MSETAIPLVRRGRRNARYTAISNEIIDHPTLSPEARIALIYLLSKPDDWRLQINDIRRLLGRNGTPCGRNKAYEVIKELKASAYVLAVEELRKGRFHRLTYYVFDEPITDPDAFRAGLKADRPEAGDGAIGPNPPPSEAPLPEFRDTVATPRPGFRDPVFRDLKKGELTKDREPQNPDSPPPSPERRRSSWPGKEEVGFSKFWTDWPEALRPRARSQAASLFAAQSSSEQRLAVQFAQAYRTRQGSGGFAPMLPYLRHRLFAEFDGAPQIDGGHFVITPDRPEWLPWIDHLRAHHSASVVERQAAKGRFLAPTRWPPSAAEGSAALNKISTRLSA